MSYRSIATINSPAHPISVPPPSGIVDTDILIALSTDDTGSSTPSFPAGFTQPTGSPINMTTADANTFAVALKIAASESGNYSLGSTSNICGGVIAVSGREQFVTPHRFSATTHDSFVASPWSMTSSAFPTVTTKTCDIIYIAVSDGLAADAVHTAPAGYTLDADITDATGFWQFMVAHKDGVAAGETGVLTGVGTLAANSASWAVYVIALADAGSPAAISGTAISSITEADIVTGGKTIIITLTGETWIP